jgi:integrase
VTLKEVLDDYLRGAILSYVKQAMQEQTITDTKNHESHTLLLYDYLADLLIQRKGIATTEFVFPGNGIGGYIVEPRKRMEKFIKISGIQFITHDLRHTFITIAEGLDISAYAVKRLANHKMNQVKSLFKCPNCGVQVLAPREGE